MGSFCQELVCQHSCQRAGRCGQSSSHSLERPEGDKTQGVSPEGHSKFSLWQSSSQCTGFRAGAGLGPRVLQTPFLAKASLPPEAELFPVWELGWQVRPTPESCLIPPPWHQEAFVNPPGYHSLVLQQAESLGLLSRGQREGRKKVCAAASRRHGATMPLFLFYVWSPII